MEKQLSVHRGGHLEALLNGCPDAILAIDAEGTIKFANKEACKLTERGMSELIGENIVIVYEDEQAAKAANQNIYEGGGTLHNYDSKLRTKSGKLIPIRLSASHLKDSAGKYIGGVGYFAPYRPWGDAETQIKGRVEELEAEIEKWKVLASPVFELYSGLSVTEIAGSLDVNRCEEITTKLLTYIENVKTRVVIIDLSAAVVSDNEIASQLAKAVRTISLLGANCIISGTQTSLARAMEPLISELGTAKSFSRMELALEEAFKMIGHEIRRKD
ncbi:PAS domain-containing protein [Chloroflexota bacterium]